MSIKLNRVVAALAAAGIVAGFAASPVAAGPSVAGSSLARTHVIVIMECDDNLICTASARGGTGTYEGFEWSLASEISDDGSWSTADVAPYCVPGAVLGVDATVTDSSGARGTGSITVFCPR